MRALFDVPTHSDRGRGRARGDVCRLCLAAREAVEFPLTPRVRYHGTHSCRGPLPSARTSGSAPKEVMHNAGKIPEPVNPLTRGPGLLTCRPGPSLPRPRLEAAVRAGTESWKPNHHGQVDDPPDYGESVRALYDAEEL
jgi:hypothetical protein